METWLETLNDHLQTEAELCVNFVFLELQYCATTAAR